MSNYDQLIELVDSGHVRIIGVLSPPRVCSTAFEILLTQSPDVDGQINEPFHISASEPVTERYRTDIEERAYGEILKRIREIKKVSDQRPAPITIIMKEMAKNIPPGEAFNRWVSITDKQVVLVRNPLLNVYSFIRLLADMVTDNSTENYRLRLSHAKEAHNYSKLDAELQNALPLSNPYYFNPAMKEAYINLIAEEFAHRLGYESLDMYARKLDYPSWENLRSDKDKAHLLYPFLSELFAFRNLGWDSLKEHLPYMKSLIIVDTTMLRASQEDILPEIMSRLGIRSADAMLEEWRKSVGEKFSRGHGKMGAGSPFIDKAVKSTCLTLPAERPGPIEALPPFLHDYILKVALPCYVKLIMCPEFIVHQRDGKKQCSMLERIVSKDTDESLYSIDPVFSYIVLSTAPFSSQVEKQGLLREHRALHEEKFGLVFDTVDQLVKVNTHVENKGMQYASCNISPDFRYVA